VSIDGHFADISELFRKAVKMCNLTVACRLHGKLFLAVLLGHTEAAGYPELSILASLVSSLHSVIEHTHPWRWFRIKESLSLTFARNF
jgi:hypothetical protein